MSFLLSCTDSKSQNLEAYLNEIYLGQAGDRAIHGFGMAAQFYFGKIWISWRQRSWLC